MKFIFLFLLTPMFSFGQVSNDEFYDKEYSTNKLLYETAAKIDSLAEGFAFKIEKQYPIKILLKNISFYEQMVNEINNEKDPNVRKGLIKSIIISDNNLSEILKETHGDYEISQILKGTLQALRRQAVLNMWQEYKHFLDSKQNFSH